MSPIRLQIAPTLSRSEEAILRDGFKDGTGQYLTEQLHSGVWLSNEPLDCNEGAKGDVLLEVALDMGEDDFAAYEWPEGGRAPWLNGTTLLVRVIGWRWSQLSRRAW